jgi:hypothetical protein
MKKVKLDLESLEIESFEPQASFAEEGTVVAYLPSHDVYDAYCVYRSPLYVNDAGCTPVCHTAAYNCTMEC